LAQKKSQGHSMQNSVNFEEQELITPLYDFDCFKTGNCYRVLGKSKHKQLGNCYLIEDKLNNKVEPFPIMFADARFVPVTEKYH
jgi:hypothetical protein